MTVICTSASALPTHSVAKHDRPKHQQALLCCSVSAVTWQTGGDVCNSVRPGNYSYQHQRQQLGLCQLQTGVYHCKGARNLHILPHIDYWRPENQAWWYGKHWWCQLDLRCWLIPSSDRSELCANRWQNPLKFNPISLNSFYKETSVERTMF